MDYEIIKVPLITGLATTGTIFLCGIISGLQYPKHDFDWRDVAFVGSMGAILGAHYSVTGNYWFKSLYY
jgi:hypothetical protein